MATPAARIENVQPPATIAAGDLARSLALEGRDIIDLSQSSPYHVTPPHIVAAGISASVVDLLQDPHLDEIGFWPLFQHPSEGEIRMVGQPIRFEDTPASYRRGAPRLGEHSTEILSEAGLEAAGIETLIAAGAVKQGA